MILVCGEALVDVFSSGTRERLLRMEGHDGGSPFNVAVGLARLKRPVSFLGALADDFFGKRLRRTLEGEGVGLSHAKRSARPTPLSFVSVAEDGLVAYAFRNEGAADHDLLPADFPEVMPEEVNCVTLGSYTLGLDPAGESVTRFAERIAASHVVSFDPNVRPDLIADDVLWRDRFERSVRAASIVKISMEDMDHAFGPGANVDAIATRWLAEETALVLVTDGPQPVRVYGPFGRIEVQGPAVTVVDTVGAGDSFHAAFLAFLDQRGQMTRTALRRLDRTFARDATEYACRAAAITCSRRGADLPHKGDLPIAN